VLLNRGTEYIGALDIMNVNDNGRVRLKVNAVEDTYNKRKLNLTTRLLTMIMGENEKHANYKN
jgi:hypothetical protein